MSQGLAYRAGLNFLAGAGLPGQQAAELVFWRGSFYRWTGSYYRRVGDPAITAEFTRWLARNPTARAESEQRIRPVTTAFARDGMLAVRSESAISDELEPGSWIGDPPEGSAGPFRATPGGILDLGRLGEPEGPLLPPDPRFFGLSTLAITPSGAGAPDCPTWLGFLGETFPGDPTPIAVVQEMFGYALLPDCRFEAFFVLVGDGGSGRSTVAETLQAMLGAANCAALNPERLGERFATAALVGKLANLITDCNEFDHAAEGTFKALISGEPVLVEEKHHPAATMRLTAKHVLVTNVLPRFRDTSAGLWRRLILLPFDRVCPPEQRDVGLKAKLRAELPGIARWALRGLARLLEQGRFTEFDRGRALADRYRAESNPTRLFLEAACEINPSARVGRQALYDGYRRWAAANGHAALSSTKFYREVEALRPQPAELPREGRGGDRMFVGLALREPGDLVQQFKVLAPPRARAEGQ